MTDEKLVRGLSRWDLTAIVINTVIGAGIFGLPSKAAALIGNYSIPAFIACALIIALIVLCFAEVSSRFSATGGMYLYAKTAFGNAVGFEVNWLYWIVRATTFATNTGFFLGYLTLFFPDADKGATRTLIVCGIIGFIFVVNLAGVKQATWITNLFTVGKLIPLILFAIIGAFFISPQNFAFGALPETASISKAFLLLIYAFVGFEAAAIPAGETKDPQKSMPFALLVALGVVSVLLIAVQIVAIGTLPNLAESKKPLADAAMQFMGSFGASFITVGALISIAGNLNTGFLTASRLPYAMAVNGEIPAVIGTTHEKLKTPWLAMMLTAALTLVVTLPTSLVDVLTISTITRLIVYATTCGALLIFRYRKNAAEAKFTLRGGIPVAVLSLILIGWLLSNVDYAKEGLAALVAIILGFLLFGASKLFFQASRTQRT